MKQETSPTFRMKSDLENAYDCLRFEISPRRFAMIVRRAQRAVSCTPGQVVDLINGGVDGWDSGLMEVQQRYYDHTPTSQIASWVYDCLR